MTRASSIVLHNGSPEVVPSRSGSTSGAGRVAGIDLARGVAMFFVCLSHFADVYFGAGSGESQADALRDIGMIASPMFVILSGMMLGFMYRTHGAAFAATKRKLLDRALFMITIGHVLIVLVTMKRMGSIHQPWMVIYITDVIAVCVVVGCALIGRLDVRQRMILGLALYGVSWLTVLFWHPAVLPLRRIEHLLVGPFQGNSWIYAVPLLPWLGVYVASSALGEYFGAMPKHQREAVFSRLLLRGGGLAVGLGIGVKLSFLALKALRELPTGEAFRMVYLSSTPMEKLPPSPDYLLCFGGIGLVLTALLIRASAIAPSRVTSVLGAVGRSSLFVFFVQFFVYYTVLFDIRPFQYSLWPFALAMSFVAIAMPAIAWDAAGLNRYLSLRVWITSLHQRFRSAPSAPAA
jgi:uncharacterized membrane protein